MADPLRHALGLTQAEFAALLGHAVPTVARWEAGRAKPCPVSRVFLEELTAHLPPSGEQRDKALDFLRKCARNGGYRAFIAKAISAAFDRYAGLLFDTESP
jgi:transcriptional regulator with XRE-family HTH domain